MNSCNFYRRMAMNDRDSKRIERTPLYNKENNQKTGWNIALCLMIVVATIIVLLKDLS